MEEILSKALNKLSSKWKKKFKGEGFTQRQSKLITDFQGELIIIILSILSDLDDLYDVNSSNSRAISDHVNRSFNNLSDTLKEKGIEFDYVEHETIELTNDEWLNRNSED